METTWIFALVAAFALAAAHKGARSLERLPKRHEDRLDSLVGGAGLSYVFLYLFFELAHEGAPKLHALLPLTPSPLESLFLVLLLAVTVSYLLQMRLQRSPDAHDDHTGLGAFFVGYNVLAGAALVEEARWGVLNLGFYALVIGLHMLFNDRLLAHTCPQAHGPRWHIALGAAPVVGCLLALLPAPDGVRYVLLALMAGATVLNVIRLELPGPGSLRVGWFMSGTAAYALLIFVTWRFG